jgi:CRP-like cAMP-binding protein
MTRIETWHGTKWNGQGQTLSLPQDWLSRALAKAPLFHGLSKQDLRAVAGLAELRQYVDGVAVVRVGTRGDAMHVILDGSAVVQPTAGPERRLEPGDCFGELALVDGAPRAATVVAAGELATARIAGPGFRRILREEPLVAVGLLPGLVRVIRDLQAALRAESSGRAPDEQTPFGTAFDPETGIVDGSAVRDARDLLGWYTALRHVPLFETLPERHLRQVARRFAVRQYGTGRVVVRQGAKGNSFFLLLAGRVRVEARDGSSTILDPGAGFGELALIDGAPRSATVTSLDQVTVAELPRAAFQRLLQNEPRTAVPMIASLVALIRKLEAQSMA